MDQREVGRWEAACELTPLHSLLRAFQGAFLGFFMLDLKAAACMAAQSTAILQCVPHGWLMPALET